jgi:hypothetical protein
MFYGASQTMRFSPNSRRNMDEGDATTDAGSGNKAIKISGGAGGI